MDEAPNVLDAESLGVQVDNGGSFVEVTVTTAHRIGKLGVSIVLGVVVLWQCQDRPGL